MKYFACFKEGVLETFWEREDEFTHPDHVDPSQVRELTQEQHENRTFLTCTGEKVEFLSNYAEYKANAYKKLRRLKYKEIEDEAFEALIESKLGNDTKWNAYLLKRNQIKLDYPKPT